MNFARDAWKFLLTKLRLADADERTFAFNNETSSPLRETQDRHLSKRGLMPR